jgi:hypothetical protein
MTSHVCVYLHVYLSIYVHVFMYTYVCVHVCITRGPVSLEITNTTVQVGHHYQDLYVLHSHAEQFALLPSHHLESRPSMTFSGLCSH